MEEDYVAQPSFDSLGRSESNLSLASSFTYDSHRSSINTLNSLTKARRKHGLMNKLGSSLNTIFQRFSKKYQTLSALEIQILSTITNFSREEVLEWHSKFLADCPNGYLSRKQFISMYTSLCPSGNAERFAGHVFRAFDLDKSNSVDFREFLIGLSMTSTTSSPQTKLEWIFQVFDIDGNGLLTRSESLEVIDVIIRFNASQQCDEKYADIEQLIYTAKKSMMAIFDNIADGLNNTLTITQFVEGCLKDQFIHELLAPSAKTSTSDVTNAELA